MSLINIQSTEVSMGCISVGSFSNYTRLDQVPPHRQLEATDFLMRVRRAVDFEYVCFGGLDLEGYQIGYGRSLDTELAREICTAGISGISA